MTYLIRTDYRDHRDADDAFSFYYAVAISDPEAAKAAVPHEVHGIRERIEVFATLGSKAVTAIALEPGSVQRVL